MLSGDGKLWLLKALVNLQMAIEQKLKDDPKIERNNQAFKEFAFSSHVPAYVNAGILRQSVMDKTIIALTPDPEDLFSTGAEQAIKIGALQINYYLNHPDFASSQIGEAAVKAPQIIALISQYALKHGLNPALVPKVVSQYLPTK